MNKFRVFLLVACTFLSNYVIADEVDSEKRNLILQLMGMRGYTVDIMGQKLAFQKTMSIQGFIQKRNISVPKETLHALKVDVEKIIEEDFIKPDDYTELAVGVYDSYLTTEELKKIVEFLNTPSGKKFIQYIAVIDGDVDHAANGLLPDINDKINHKVNDTIAPFIK